MAAAAEPIARSTREEKQFDRVRLVRPKPKPEHSVEEDERVAGASTPSASPPPDPIDTLPMPEVIQLLISPVRGHATNTWASAARRVQETHGNRFVQRLMSAQPPQRQCACGGSCAKCQEEKERRVLQRSSTAAAPTEFDAIPTAHGEPLDVASRRPLEAHFGADLSDVRVHTGSEAEKSATSLDALAYTSGRDIYFGAGMYAPASDSGRRLLAHEVAHVVQQGSGKEPSIATKSSNGVKIGAPDDMLEGEADRAAKEFMSGTPVELSDEEQRKKRESSGAVQRFIQRQGTGGTANREEGESLPGGPGMERTVPPGTKSEVPPPPGSPAAVRDEASKIGEQWGNLLAEEEIALDQLQTKHLGVSVWDRITAAEKGRWAKAVQDEFAKLPLLPQVDEPELVAAQEEGFQAGLESGYSDVKFTAFLIKVGTEIAIALFSGLAARGVRLPRFISQILQQAERKALIEELAAAGVKFTEEKIVEIARSAAGKVVFLEQGTAQSGLQHVILGHGDDFARIGVSGESNITNLIINTLKTQTAVRTLAGGEQVFKVVVNGVERGLQIVVANNGYIVTAFPVGL